MRKGDNKNLVVLVWKIKGNTKIDICMYLYRSETDIILVPVKSSPHSVLISLEP
jgi:hypothetical protein